MTVAKTPVRRTAKAPAARAAKATVEASAISQAPIAPAAVEEPIVAAPVASAPVAAEPVGPAAAPVEASAPAAAAAPTFAFPAFDLPKIDAAALDPAQVPAAFRDFAEKAVAQAKASFEKLKDATEEATGAIEEACATARAGLSQINAQSIDAFKANSDAAYAHARDLLAVKTVAEAIELQSTYLRQQFEVIAAQAKGFQATATKFAGEAAQPTKEVFDKAFQVLKSDR